MPEDSGSHPEDRRAELVRTVAAVRAQIVHACRDAGRDPHSVTLVAVTKTYPAEDVHTLLTLGVGDFGESRDQEAVAKIARLSEVVAGAAEQLRTPRWHFVGQLQSRKCASVAGYADAVHSLDRPQIAARLQRACEQLDRAPLDVFIQVSLDGDPHRGGVAASQLSAFADEVAGLDRLRLRGVMAVPPLDAELAAAFTRLRELSQALTQHHPAADAISAGMSADFAEAIRHGSTHVRVGSALLGRRAPGFD